MHSKNKHYFRYLDNEIDLLIKEKYSCLIMGPRQVGKTTLVKSRTSKIENKIEYPLQNPSLRRNLEVNPQRMLNQVKALPPHPLVFIDEVQKVPELFDIAQILLDDKEAQFILTGSSARKLRKQSINLLPGRIKRFYLNPLSWGELGYIKDNTIKNLSINNINPLSEYSFEDSLVFGTLPGIVNLPDKDKKDFLMAYSETYLEEEIRAEAISRKIGSFSSFLELAASESGSNPNFTKLSNESGVSQPAIKEFYNILEDTLIVHKIDPYLKNARKRILSSSRYYFFDTGVRNALSRAPLSKELINVQKGKLFEHAVLLEIIRRVNIIDRNFKIYYWRTSTGSEVDCVIDCGKVIIPIEIKSSSYVSLSEIKGLKSFLKDYSDIAPQGFVITMGGIKEKLDYNITAIPWFSL